MARNRGKPKEPSLSLSVGADPEMFIGDAATLEVVPVCGWLGGTKAEPKSLGTKGFFVQEDNIMAEYNIPPAEGPTQFANNILLGKRMVETLVASVDSRYTILPVNNVCMRRSQLLSKGGMGAMMFGCSPEFNAYESGAECERVSPELLMVESTMADSDVAEMRYAGGHLHIGLTVDGEYALDVPRFAIAAMCDAMIGLPCVAGDKQGGRRLLYGRAGRFRPTKYGIEYRTLSNFWVHDRDWLQNVSHDVFSFLSNVKAHGVPYVRRMFDTIPWEDVQSAINNEDVNLAYELTSYITGDLHAEAA